MLEYEHSNYDSWICPKCHSDHTDWCDEEWSDNDIFQSYWECKDCGCKYVNEYKAIPTKQFIAE